VQTQSPTPHPDVVWRRVGEEAVLVNLKTNRIYSLNDTGARLWELISSGHDRESAEATLLEEFEVGKEELRNEVAAVLQDLAREGLIVESARSEEPSG
jgi:Coenzyme PQQ synthesis protein D (PqqD)